MNATRIWGIVTAVALVSLPALATAGLIADVTVLGTHSVFLAGVPNGVYTLADVPTSAPWDQHMVDDLNDSFTRPIAINVTGFSQLAITAACATPDECWSHTPTRDSGPDGKGSGDPTRDVYELRHRASR